MVFFCCSWDTFVCQFGRLFGLFGGGLEGVISHHKWVLLMGIIILFVHQYNILNEGNRRLINEIY